MFPAWPLQTFAWRRPRASAWPTSLRPCVLAMLGFRWPARSACFGGIARLEAGEQIVEPQLLQALPDLLQLGCGVLDQGLALAAEIQGLAQAGLVRVEPRDDLLEPLDGTLVALRLNAHGPSSLPVTWAGTEPSAMRRSKLPAARTAAAPVSGS